MSRKIKIGITQRVDKVDSYNEYRDALDQKMIDWVVDAGFIPILWLIWIHLMNLNQDLEDG